MIPGDCISPRQKKGGDMTDLSRKLEEKKKERSKHGKSIFWRPVNQGDRVEGIVRKMGTTITAYGESDFIELETDQGMVTVWLNSVLKRQVEEEKVREDDHIAIEFLGVVSSSKNKKKAYKDYILVKADEDAGGEEI